MSSSALTPFEPGTRRSRPPETGPPGAGDAPGTPERPPGWTGWVPWAAVLWAATYGVLALIWTLTGGGYPYGVNDPRTENSPLTYLSPQVGAPLFAGVLLATAVALLAMAGRHSVRLRGTPRKLLLGFGWAVAAVLLVVVPTASVLAITGYAPMLIIGAPFGWPPEVDYGAIFNWSLANQAWAMIGGFLVAFTVLSWQRRTRGACGHCGRTHEATAADRARLLRWSRWATIAAVVIPLLYSVSRLSWLAGIPLGISHQMLRELWDSGAVWAGAGLGTFAVVGAVLTLGLIQRWGEVFPRWIPGLAGRRVPIKLAVIPASYVVPIVISGGIGLATSPSLWRQTGYSKMLIIPHALWPLWGVALAMATYGYHLRRRGACAVCGRRG